MGGLPQLMLGVRGSVPSSSPTAQRHKGRGVSGPAPPPPHHHHQAPGVRDRAACPYPSPSGERRAVLCNQTQPKQTKPTFRPRPGGCPPPPK